MSGLTRNGFETKSFDTILEEQADKYEADIGQPINRTAKGLIYRGFSVVAEQLESLWQLGLALYGCYYPSAAEDACLDNAAELTGITRKAADESTATVLAVGTASTVVPAGTQVSSSTTGDVFETDAAVTILDTASVRNVIEVTGVLAAGVYEIYINAVKYDYVAGGSPTAQQIVTGIINDLSINGAPMQGVDNGDGVSLTITSVDNETSYSVSVATIGVGASLAINETGSPVDVTALVAGEKLVNAGQIDTIVTPVVGLNSVAHILDGIEGREIETDAELRLGLTRVRLGKATADAIRSRIFEEVDGVTSVIVIENSTEFTVSGRPPHSIEVIVEGGSDQDIGDKLWEVKPAGIQTFGGETVTVLDGSGNSQTVYFSRPTLKYAWIEVVYTKYDEETFPADGEAAIAAAVLEYGDTFTIGLDMLWQRFLTPVMETNGVKSAQIKLDVTATAGGPPSYVTDTDVAIAEDELAVFDAARITVSEAP
jgi:uncharacterized phage protein gp47/JayE